MNSTTKDRIDELGSQENDVNVTPHTTNSSDHDNNSRSQGFDERLEREMALRRRVLTYVVRHFGDEEIRTAGDAIRELLSDAHSEMAKELLWPIFAWSDYWPKRMAAEILELPEDEDYEWSEVLELFEGMDTKEEPDQK